MTEKIRDAELNAEALTDEELEEANGGIQLKVAKQKDDDDLTYRNTGVIPFYY